MWRSHSSPVSATVGRINWADDRRWRLGPDPAALWLAERCAQGVEPLRPPHLLVILHLADRPEAPLSELSLELTPSGGRVTGLHFGRVSLELFPVGDVISLSAADDEPLAVLLLRFGELIRAGADVPDAEGGEVGKPLLFVGRQPPLTTAEPLHWAGRSDMD